ncbi:hypothetical protein SORBI_3003G034350 [Sorghum bicolor]|uniref:Uncharacterized protein n=1 Tax=Sorghum bicolor TaxID=4558 RepID=A0A1W0VVL4_SORBI|nr:hypothetical protein SORBI_3003G034350 [Sorghum bicolor]
MSPAGEQAAAPYGRLRPHPTGGGGGVSGRALPATLRPTAARAATQLCGAAASRRCCYPIVDSSRTARDRESRDRLFLLAATCPAASRATTTTASRPFPRPPAAQGEWCPCPRCVAWCPAPPRPAHTTSPLGSGHAGTPGVQNPAWARCDVVGLPQPPYYPPTRRSTMELLSNGHPPQLESWTSYSGRGSDQNRRDPIHIFALFITLPATLWVHAYVVGSGLINRVLHYC